MSRREPGAGELTRRVIIRRRTDAPFADAELVPEFPEQRKTWAKVEPVGGVVYAAGVQAESLVTHRVIVRYRHGITEAHEVVERHAGADTVYRVRRSYDLNGARRFTVIEVEELGSYGGSPDAGGLPAY